MGLLGSTALCRSQPRKSTYSQKYAFTKTDLRVLHRHHIVESAMDVTRGRHEGEHVEVSPRNSIHVLIPQAQTNLDST